jgi:uncharacterized protein YcbX
LPASDAELRGVTIWRDTLRVPDAGDEAGAWVSNSLANRRAWCKCHWIARMTEAGYGKDDDQVAFADGYPLLLIGRHRWKTCRKSRT